jgi:hypothetical protein
MAVVNAVTVCTTLGEADTDVVMALTVLGIQVVAKHGSMIVKVIVYVSL